MKYKTAFIENTWLRNRDLPDEIQYLSHGWGNGYVIIPEDNPLHGLGYDTANHFVVAHGGLTYAELCTQDKIEVFNLEDSDVGKWIFGFDTAHSGDTMERWSLGAVQAETDNLLAQVIGFAGKDKEQLLSGIICKV